MNTNIPRSGITLGYIHISPLRWWKYMYKSGSYFGIFRNSKGIIPGRWGFYILGLEIGSRDPGDTEGVFLKEIGLWPW